VQVARRCSSADAVSKASGLPVDIAFSGISMDSRALGCQPAIFHGRQKSNVLQEIWDCQFKADLAPVRENHTAWSSLALPSPPHPPKMYASSRIWRSLKRISFQKRPAKRHLLLKTSRNTGHFSQKKHQKPPENLQKTSNHMLFPMTLSGPQIQLLCDFFFFGQFSPFFQHGRNGLSDTVTSLILGYSPCFHIAH